MLKVCACTGNSTDVQKVMDYVDYYCPAFLLAFIDSFGEMNSSLALSRAHSKMVTAQLKLGVTVYVEFVVPNFLPNGNLRFAC
jgi:hypothetical protein